MNDATEDPDASKDTLSRQLRRLRCHDWIAQLLDVDESTIPSVAFSEDVFIEPIVEREEEWTERYAADYRERLRNGQSLVESLESYRIRNSELNACGRKIGGRMRDVSTQINEIEARATAQSVDVNVLRRESVAELRMKWSELNDLQRWLVQWECIYELRTRVLQACILEHELSAEIPVDEARRQLQVRDAELAARNRKILKLRDDKRRLTLMATRPSKEDLRSLIDEHRFKTSKKVNLSALGRRLAKDPGTVRKWISEAGLEAYASLT